MKKIVESFHHFFVPRHTNNFKSKLLHHDFLTIYLACALMLTAGVGHLQNTQGSILGYATDISPQKLLDLTNRERSEEGLGELTYNAKLEQAAKKKAENMYEKDYWSHYGPAGETPWEFILGSGYQYEFAGENLAKNFLFSDGVVQAWMDSPTHRENILRKEYTDVGFAVVNGILNGEETTLVVQMFGKPLYAAAQAPQEKSIEKAGAALPANLNPTEVLSEKQATQPAFYSMFLNINLIFFGVLVLALLLDFYFAAKLNLIHIKGKNLIHILFISSITIGTIFVIRGSTL
ncbi:CAP domain-containing protein [Candidatus Woesebacteria bacterium]|nr:CAP domain-containing protein [Candidatus Woesebacteria bacterium]